MKHGGEDAGHNARIQGSAAANPVKTVVMTAPTTTIQFPASIQSSCKPLP